MKTLAALLLTLTFSLTHAQLLKVGVAGMSHDHTWSIMNQHKNGQVILVGIAEDDPVLIARYKKNFNLPDSIFFKSVAEMLAHVKPEAVLAYNAIADHRAVVEACAPKGIHVMVEKPLATTVADAERMEALAKQHHIHLLTNYETTWYPTNQQLGTMVNDQHSIGELRRLVVHDGHQGPKEIGCSKEFLAWLTDPVKNGGGALMDFGCYGANLMTWLMKGKEPIAVTAITHHIKPGVYPNVDDDATILLEYENATGEIEASWNWPFSIKDLEVFGTTGYLHALNGNVLQQRLTDKYTDLPVAPPAYTDNLVYFADVIRGRIKSDNDLSSLNNNMTVVRILSAARQSAKQGKRILFVK